MPLQPGNTRHVISGNISELVRSGYPVQQAAAIAYHNARRHSTRSGHATSGHHASPKPLQRAFK